ncbi:uncharacterized protein A1O5_08648 [Cladophialophora psammophila CBS 110553]|uniref:Zn(2)-C6 fungal-type domain-containing protein n=1 Tax=Cladophialophora psammophila CBS 110553 TaxID=1182543 RepID=W9WJE3_9EURO|nr:uncharacterized protein A1O5_08648 [Cladophialophora psammophila CBS 110553]EXJ68033.1 hypothetical protein A1O5_08648 [Cladophialophora psammophila CBS 110553]
MPQHRTQPQARPLRPALGGAAALPGSVPLDPSIAIDENTGIRDASAPNPQRSAKKNATIACQACKISKRKCDQHQPCSNCQASNKTCIYDPSQDGRRKESRKRRLNELELRSHALDRILISLKHSSSPEARQLLELIKQDAPLEEIILFLDTHPGPAANETRAALSASPPPEGDGIRRMLAISELTDNPTFRVPAAPWTTVTKDDLLVSHLVSAYINWYHFYYHNFDEKLFLAAMAKGNLDSSYCSPFLVNAVLGMGCFFSDHPLAFATPGEVGSRGLHFYNEAHRLWTLEAAKPTLTNIQGFTIMIMTAAFTGKDRVSFSSLKQLEVMMPQLLRRHPKSGKSQPISEDFERSLKIVEWAAHIYSTGFGTGFLIAPTSPKPSLEAPYASKVWLNHLTPWSPYPMAGDPVQLPLQALYHYMCELYVFAGDIQSLVFADFSTMSTMEKLNAAREMDRKMLEWYSSIPQQFQVDDPNFVLVPTTVDLALSLHHFRLLMWNWTIPPPPSASKPNAEPEQRSATGTSPDAPIPGQDELDQIAREAKEMCMEIASVTVRIIRAFNASFGHRFFTVLTPQSGILAASFLLSGNLHSADEEELLLDIMRVLVRCSRQRQLVKGITHMLLKTAEDKVVAAGNGDTPPPGGVSKSLLEQLTVIVKDIAWEGQEHLTFSSKYPNHILVKEDPDTELSLLLEKWAHMGLDDEEHDGGEGSDDHNQSTDRGREEAA